MERIITIESSIRASYSKVWDCLTDPGHIVHWNRATDDWISPRAENDLRVGGKFNYRMEARDGSAGFDFEGVFDRVVPGRHLDYTLGDGRKMKTTLTAAEGETKIVTVFEAEDVYPLEQQRQGWQAILDNLKKYAESLK